MPDCKVAIMTGTGQGIGAGCAREMAKAGYKVSFEEIGQACAFLASDAARYMNGQSILSDGGMNRAVR